MPRLSALVTSLVLVPAALVLLGAPGASAAGTVVVASSTLDTDSEGWTVYGEALGPNYQAAGGKTGGYISADDPPGTSGTSYWKAPAKYLGSMGQAFNGKLSFDVRDVGQGSTFSDADVVLQSGSVVLVYRQKKRPKGTKWAHFNVKLSGKKGWADGSTGKKATPQQMQTVLGSLDMLLIRGEYRNGPETLDLDNVVIRAKAP